MNSLRWLLHLARCWFYRWQARDALDGIECAQVVAKSERRRMNRALAREEELTRSWKQWQQRVQEGTR